MGIITSIRAPVPVAEVPTPPAPPSRLQGANGATAPVAATALEHAVQQVPPKSAATDPRVMMAWASAEASAAAESARQAYIKASVAAGVSPLPLP